jgi:nucleotide-binding universal stress UspA family protein
MGMFERILAPLDRSAVAEQVLPAVAELAAAFESEVAVVDVCVDVGGEEERACHLYVGRKAGELQAHLGGTKARVKTAVVPGMADQEILRYAEADRADLIVMSSHGQSGIMRWSLGGTVDRVLKQSSTPLLIIRASEPPEARSVFSRIAVPVDGSESSEAILPLVAQLARALPRELVLVRVIEPGRQVRTIGGLDYVPFKERDVAATRVEIVDYLNKVSAGLAGVGADVSCEVREGEAAEEIMRLADEKGCTLIAMSSHGHSKVRTWSMGSVLSRIARCSTQSVLLAPSMVTE